VANTQQHQATTHYSAKVLRLPVTKYDISEKFFMPNSWGLVLKKLIPIKKHQTTHGMMYTAL